MSSVEIGAGKVVGTFSWFRDGSDRWIAHNDIYVQDLNNDGVEEVIFAGFETQPNTPAEFSNISVSVWGWKDGVFQNLTTSWMPNGINHLEGVGDLAFGDFDGDKRLDVYFSGYADMDHSVNSYVFYNRGTYFERASLGLTVWEHGAAAGDINGDGYDDVVVGGYLNPAPLYLGSSKGLVKTPLTGGEKSGSYATFSSGVTFGKFLSKDSLSLVIVDSAPANGPSDTVLTRPEYQGGVIVGFEVVSTLPIPRLELPQFNIQTQNYDKSHDVRARAIDLNFDGLDDLLVFSRAGWTGRDWPEVSQIQFLLNDGGGRFRDVTESYIFGYNAQSNISYHPRVKDFNLDGRLDIFTSASSWGNAHDSTSLFLGRTDGTFVLAEQAGFSAVLEPVGGVSNLVQGPLGQTYLVTNTFKPLATGMQSTISLYLVSFPDRSLGESLPGTPLQDFIYGQEGDDTISGGSGDDRLDGGAGLDAATYTGVRSSYLVTKKAGVSWMVTDSNSLRDGTDSLTDIERLHFSDASIALDINGSAGQAFRVYKAAFNRDPMKGDVVGLGYWIAQMDAGMNIVEVSARFIDSAEFRALYGTSPTNADFLTRVYTNVLGRSPDAGGYEWWLNEMNSNPEKTKAKVLADFAESAENKEGVLELIGSGITYDPWGP